MTEVLLSSVVKVVVDICVSPVEGMLRRPKPSDSEADLLRDQERFLVSGSPPTAKVIRRPDKRRGRPGVNEENGESQRDVVTIAG